MSAGWISSIIWLWINTLWMEVGRSSWMGVDGGGERSELLLAIGGPGAAAWCLAVAFHTNALMNMMSMRLGMVLAVDDIYI